MDIAIYPLTRESSHLPPTQTLKLTTATSNFLNELASVDGIAKDVQYMG